MVIYRVICAPGDSKTAIDGLSLSAIAKIEVTAISPQRVLIVVDGTPV